MKQSSIGQTEPESLGTVTLGFPWREEEAGGKRQSVSFMTAVVYGSSFARCGCERRMFGKASMSFPKTESCSVRSFSKAVGFCDRR